MIDWFMFYLKKNECENWNRTDIYTSCSTLESCVITIIISIVQMDVDDNIYDKQ